MLARMSPSSVLLIVLLAALCSAHGIRKIPNGVNQWRAAIGRRLDRAHPRASRSMAASDPDLVRRQFAGLGHPFRPSQKQYEEAEAYLFRAHRFAQKSAKGETSKSGAGAKTGATFSSQQKAELAKRAKQKARVAKHGIKYDEIDGATPMRPANAPQYVIPLPPLGMEDPNYHDYEQEV